MAQEFMSIFDLPIIDEDMLDVERGKRDPRISEAMKRTGPYPKTPKKEEK